MKRAAYTIVPYYVFQYLKGMQFKARTLRAISDMVCGNDEYGELFPYRSSSYLTEFFQDCGLDYAHNGFTRWAWVASCLQELLNEPQPAAHVLPHGFMCVLRTLMDKGDARSGDPDRMKALAALNVQLTREGFEAFFDDEGITYVRHIATKVSSTPTNPHRPLTPIERKRREHLLDYLGKCSEDELIDDVLLPLLRQLGFHRITAAGHKDKALEYGKDVWMKFTLPTMHVIYFGIQAKRGKIDAAGTSKSGSSNIAEIYQQVLMMIGHQVFDPDIGKRVLVDHAFIVAAGEITKQARNWLGERLDATQRAQIMFMDRDTILDLFVTSNIPLSASALPPADPLLADDIPF